VVNGVVGWVAHERLRVNRRPRLALGGKHVPGVQIGAQQHTAIRGAWELAQHRDPFAGEPRVRAARVGREVELERVGPVIAHLLERSEWVIASGLAFPQAAEQTRSHDVLVGFRR
jgi:hypothetical protein